MREKFFRYIQIFLSFLKIKTTLNSEYGSNDAILHPSYLLMKAQSKLMKDWTNLFKVCAGYRNN